MSSSKGASIFAYLRDLSPVFDALLQRQETRDDREYKWRKLAELALQNPTAPVANGEADQLGDTEHMQPTHAMKRQASGNDAVTACTPATYAFACFAQQPSWA